MCNPAQRRPFSIFQSTKAIPSSRCSSDLGHQRVEYFFYVPDHAEVGVWMFLFIFGTVDIDLNYFGRIGKIGLFGWRRGRRNLAPITSRLRVVDGEAAGDVAVHPDPYRG